MRRIARLGSYLAASAAPNPKLATKYHFVHRFKPVCETVQLKVHFSTKKDQFPELSLARDQVSSVKFHLKEKRFSEAIKELEQSLPVLRKYLGDDHDETLNVMNLIVEVSMRENKYERAEELAVELRSILTRQLGASHPVTLRTANSLALAMFNLNKQAEAGELFLENFILTDPKDVDVDNISEMCETIRQLGMYFFSKEMYELVVEMYEECFKKTKIVFDEDSDEVMLWMVNLGTLYLHLDRYQDAEPLLRKGLKLLGDLRGDEAPETLEGMYSLAKCWDKLEMNEKADNLYQDCIERQRRVLGRDHDSTMRSMESWLFLKAKPHYEPYTPSQEE